MSRLKFDGKDGITLNKHISDFLKFCESFEIDDEEFAYVFLSLTLEGCAKKWCHTLPAASIHSFEQLVGKLQQTFDWYDFQDVLKRINELRMKPEESLKGFSFRFVHLCFEFLESDIDWVYLNINFQRLDLVSLQHFQLETSPVFHEYHNNLQITKCPDSSRNLVWPISLNMEETQTLLEEIIVCVISHPPLNLLHNNIVTVNGSNDE